MKVRDEGRNLIRISYLDGRRHMFIRFFKVRLIDYVTDSASHDRKHMPESPLSTQ